MTLYIYEIGVYSDLVDVLCSILVDVPHFMGCFVRRFVLLLSRSAECSLILVDYHIIMNTHGETKQAVRKQEDSPSQPILSESEKKAATTVAE